MKSIFLAMAALVLVSVQNAEARVIKRDMEIVKLDPALKKQFGTTKLEAELYSYSAPKGKGNFLQLKIYDVSSVCPPKVKCVWQGERKLVHDVKLTRVTSETDADGVIRTTARPDKMPLGGPVNTLTLLDYSKSHIERNLPYVYELELRRSTPNPKVKMQVSYFGSK